MRTSLLARLEALEAACAPDIEPAHLRVVFDDGAAPAEVERLQAAARSEYLAQHDGEPDGGFAYIHRVLIAPRPAGGTASGGTTNTTGSAGSDGTSGPALGAVAAMALARAQALAAAPSPARATTAQRPAAVEGGGNASAGKLRRRRERYGGVSILMTITWKVRDVRVVQEPELNTVQAVSLEARDGDFVEGCDVLLSAPGETFIAYDDLTEETVLGWALPLAPIDRITENLAAQAARAAGPAIAELPWTAGAAPG